MREVKIGIIGLGTVGSGACEAIMENGKLIAERSGVELVIKGLCDKDKKALSSAPSPKGAVKTSNAEDLINDEDIDIIVELIGGIEPAKSIIESALKNGKHVVTANKALLSECWKEIFTLAKDKGLFVHFEASVGGGIPIVRTLRESFVSNEIEIIYGILNGTTNFILTMMEEKNCTFTEALEIAQKEGIAEKDPELDISGTDSAHKLVILSILGFGQEVYPSDVYTEGISNVAAQDIVNARKWGYSIKLLAIAKDTESGLELRVHPTLISSSHLLSDVKGADNAIFIKGDMIGDSLLFGKGAGKEPTASSVVSDIVEIARQVALSGGEENPIPCTLDYASGSKNINKIEDISLPFYLRFSVIDKPGVLAGISSVLSEYGISIASVSQEERNEGGTVPVVILTYKAKEGSMREAISKIDALDYITDKTVVIRIEE